ncbi:MAG: hypothetical protein HC893_13730, partial [Chloroflexaceae bacterium]|nr:hypothetical protein [Chloroflexaceae bacterium]
EAARLLNLIIAERIVLLHSPSGAGKTSLVQAALIPALEAQGFRVLPVIRVGTDTSSGAMAGGAATNGGHPLNRYVTSVLLSLEEGLSIDQQMPFEQLRQMTLDAYVRHRLADDPIDTVLIFDQFEEILTVDPTNRTAKEIFLSNSAQPCTSIACEAVTRGKAIYGHSFLSAKTMSPVSRRIYAPSRPASRIPFASTCLASTAHSKPCNSPPVMLVSPSVMRQLPACSTTCGGGGASARWHLA